MIVNTEKTERDFELSIHHFYKKILILNDLDFNLWEAFNEIDFSSILGIIEVKEIKKLVRDYAETTGPIKDISELTVEDVLKHLSPEERENIITYLDESSSACIQIDEGVLNYTGKPRLEKYSFIFVKDKENTVFHKYGEFHKKLSLKGGYYNSNFYSTGDPDTITMIKVVGLFPACAILKLKEHKNQFENSKASGGYHFSDVYFERNAMDLIDVINDDDNLQWFAVGSALGKVRLHNESIYLENEEMQMVPLFEDESGTNNRCQCFNYFKGRKEYVKFIEKTFDKFYKEKGKKEVIKILVNHYHSLDKFEVLGKLFEKLDTRSDEYCHILNEKLALKDFAEANGIDPVIFDEGLIINNTI